MSATGLRSITLPGWLGAKTVSPTTVFASLFLLTTSCRTLVISVIPIDAFERMGSAYGVSVLFLLVSIAGVITGLLIPSLILRFRTRRVFYIAAASAFSGAFFLGLQPLPFFLLGMAGWVISTVGFEVTMNLYIMHFILRREIGLFEPKRVLFMVTAYTTGPWLGVFLRNNVSHWAPLVATMVIAVASVVYFRFLGLREAGAREALKQPPRPLRHVKRFFSQPRLRLAWGLSLARAAWWSTFIIYTPIFAVDAGLGDVAGGALVSAGVATVYSVGLWGKLGRRYGFRSLLIYGYSLSGVASIVVTILAGSAWTGAALLLLTAFVTASIDAAGNVPFLRAVRPLEREEMTGVFSTYRDASQLLPPAIFAVLLRFAPVYAVFGVAGLWMFASAWYSRFLPRRM